MLRLLTLLALVLLPALVHASDDFSISAERPSFNGTWQIRVFTISSEGSDTWGEDYNSTDKMELVEADDGGLTGTMTLYGQTFPIAGKVDYGKDRVILTWSGDHKGSDGRLVHRTFYAYRLPFYAHADAQVDMLAGTEGVSFGDDETSFGGSGSFIAVPDF